MSKSQKVILYLIIFFLRTTMNILIFQHDKIRSSPPVVILGKDVIKICNTFKGRKTMLKCDFNKNAKQLYWNQTSALHVFSVNLLHIFRKPLPENNSALVFSCKFAENFQNIFFLRTPLEGGFCKTPILCF